MDWLDWWKSLVNSTDTEQKPQGDFDKDRCGIFSTKGAICYAPNTFKLTPDVILQVVDIIKSGKTGGSINLGLHKNTKEGESSDKLLTVNVIQNTSAAFTNSTSALAAYMVAMPKTKDKLQSIQQPVYSFSQTLVKK
ncbi:hypothetical protein RF11_10498 [Thelohanellus kitauei]|uniref:Uncharacterized protein n=1 Tax=Thelohanellus kitauei TaxID=669202 RepID=A0A0C2M3C6_THEKT|nr:hypothetical protein RF11_10498 [Thelohanellus kitauei]